ncbi:universal stress protein [Streptomyces sp. NPDC051909]|uniref:universal stress protein n=1 Tax=Streptomyces sp. NPDC051909 TaxID=3154944 RepID=UPI003432BEC1
MSSDIPVHPELGTVIAGIDGSPSARTAALWAADEAARRGRSVHLVHAADTDRRALIVRAETLQAVREAGRDLLDETATAIQDRHPDLTVVKELSKLEPVAALRATAGHRGTIVVGNRGLGGFASLMLGSVGLGVAARSTVPVIVVRGDGERPETGTVTAAVHGASDLAWLPVAAAEAEARKASLRLLSGWNMLTHVGSVATRLDDPDEMTRTRVQEVREIADLLRHSHPELDVSHHVERGTSTPGILVDASAHTDLLVMGTEHRALGVAPALGRVAHVVLHHAHCPVQIVPSRFTDWERREER